MCTAGRNAPPSRAPLPTAISSAVSSEVEGAMKRPEEVRLSREEGEALLARLEANTLTAEDRRVLGKVRTFYFWLLFALREAKLSLRRLQVLVYGEKPQ